ncbi:hypothetical protein [Streptomyces purpurascens]|uniref:hypothetical protein n=1 Tax=Streptomyces purpurascens TaxID=1924 RepID=UPI003C2CDD7D
MTGNHKNTSITRRRALAVAGGTVAAGGLAAAGYPSAFADTTTATTTATATSSASSGTCMQLMSSVTEGPYYLDGALVRKNITEGKSGVPLTLRLTVVDATDGCTPVPGAAVEIWHCDAWGYYSGYTTANPGGSAPAESEDGSTADDMVYDGGGAFSGLLTLEAVQKKDPSKGYKGFLTLGIDPDAENTGAGSGGGGGTPPSGAPAPSSSPSA